MTSWGPFNCVRYRNCPLSVYNPLMLSIGQEYMSLTRSQLHSDYNCWLGRKTSTQTNKTRAFVGQTSQILVGTSLRLHSQDDKPDSKNLILFAWTKEKSISADSLKMASLTAPYFIEKLRHVKTDIEITLFQCRSYQRWPYDVRSSF